MRELTEKKGEDRFETFLREAFPEAVEICFFEFDPVDILKRLEPKLYELARSAWLAKDRNLEIVK